MKIATTCMMMRVRILILLLVVSRTCTALQIGPLLSTCVDACQLGCAEIRSVQAKHLANNENDDDDNNKNIDFQLKVPGDNRSAFTQADKAAQRVIIGSLRRAWGVQLRIIGEEDDDEDDDKTLTESMTDHMYPELNKETFRDDIGEGTEDIPVEDVTIYVDPLDGTREFVEGRLANCQTLIGIAIGNEAVAGVVGIPFPAGNLTVEPTIVYGIADVGTGVRGSPLTRGPFPLDRHIDGIRYPRPHIATSDTNVPIMKECKRIALQRFGGSNVVYGGAGNKILAAALGEVACVVQHRVGGAWDLCAPHAILKAMGGRMTDLWGNDIEIYGPSAPPRCNERGYVATPRSTEIAHDDLVATLRATPAVQEYRKSVLDQVTTPE